MHIQRPLNGQDGKFYTDKVLQRTRHAGAQTAPFHLQASVQYILAYGCVFALIQCNNNNGCIIHVWGMTLPVRGSLCVRRY